MELYKSRAFLQEQYIGYGKPIAQIAGEIGCAGKTVWNWLDRFEIPRRSTLRSGNHVTVTEDLLEYLDGTLLGDGGLYSSASDISACYHVGQKHMSYVTYVEALLCRFGIRRSGQILAMRDHSASVNTVKAFLYQSRMYRELREQRERWYPHGKKRVPTDVRLTPLSIRTWFLEDGCLHRRKDSKTLSVILCTHGFSDDGREMLADALRARLGTKHVHINKPGVIRFARSEVVRSFFEYIAPLPRALAQDYAYKYPGDR